MALTKDYLESIELSIPLKDEVYVMLHREDEDMTYNVWDLVPFDLKLLYVVKLVECYEKRFPGNKVALEDMKWTPPMTDEYKDYPVGEKQLVLTKEDMEQIELPLSDVDYLRLHAVEEAGQRWELKKDFSKVWDAYDLLEAKYFDKRYPGNDVSFDDITWHMPPNITMDNVYDIEDPIAKKMALIELLKEEAISVLWKRALDNHPRLVKNLKELEEKEKTKTDEAMKDTVENEDANSHKTKEIPEDIINSPAYKKYVILSRASKKVNDRFALEEVAFKLIKEGDGTDRGQWANDLMIYHSKEVAAVFGSNPYEVAGQLEDMWDAGKYEDVDTGLCMSWNDWADFFCNDVTKRVYSYFVDEHKKRSYYEEEEERLRNKLMELKKFLNKYFSIQQNISIFDAE